MSRLIVSCMMIFLLSMAMIPQSFALYSIPPTNAYQKIITDNATVTAKHWNSGITFKATKGSIKGSNNGQTIYFNFTGTNGTNGSNGRNGTNGVNGTTIGAITCATNSQLHSLTVSGSTGTLHCATNNSTGSSQTLDTMSNVGTSGFGFYKNNSTNTQFNFRNLTSDRTDLVSLTQDANNVHLTSTLKLPNKNCGANNFLQILVNTTGFTCAAGNTGTITGASNLGTSGFGFFSGTSGTTLQFFKLISGNSNCVITQNSTNNIITCSQTFTNTAQISNADHANQGLTGSRLNATANTIKTIGPGSNISMTSNSTHVTINSSTWQNNTLNSLPCYSNCNIIRNDNYTSITNSSSTVTIRPGVQTSNVVYINDKNINDYTTPSNATASSSKSSVGGAVSLDGSSVTTTGTYLSNSEDDSISITLGANSNIVIVGISIDAIAVNGYTVSSVKIGSNSFTQAIVKSNANGDSQLWYLLNPPTGAQTITVHVNSAASNSFVYGATSFNGVSAIGATASAGSLASAAMTVNITPTHTGAWLMDCIQLTAASDNLTPAQTQLYHTNILSNRAGSQYKSNPTINSPNAMSWTNSNSNWELTTLEIIPSTGTTYTASNAVDNVLTTRWQSNSEANPNIYVDLGTGSNIVGLAIYPDLTHGNATQIELDSSTDHSTWTKTRTINTSLLTNSTWNFIRWDIPNTLQPRYDRIYGTDGDHRVLAIVEIKLLLPTTWQLITQHGHKYINATDATLIPNT